MGEGPKRTGCISTCYCCPWNFNFQLTYSLLRGWSSPNSYSSCKIHRDSLSLGDARWPSHSTCCVEWFSIRTLTFGVENTGCTLCPHSPPHETVGSGRIKWHIIRAFLSSISHSAWHTAELSRAYELNSLHQLREWKVKTQRVLIRGAFATIRETLENLWNLLSKRIFSPISSYPKISKLWCKKSVEKKKHIWETIRIYLVLRWKVLFAFFFLQTCA